MLDDLRGGGGLYYWLRRIIFRRQWNYWNIPGPAQTRIFTSPIHNRHFRGRIGNFGLQRELGDLQLVHLVLQLVYLG